MKASLFRGLREFFIRSPGRQAVVYVFDDNYALPTAISLRSLLDHYSFEHPLDIYLVGAGISPRSKDLFTRSIEAFPAGRGDLLTVEWLAAELEPVLGIRADPPYRAINFLRILMPDLLAHTYDRVLYLDSDTIVRSDISPLFHVPFHGAALLAAQDRIGWLSNPLCGLHEYAASSGISPRAKYFNCGVLLFNLSRWRKENLSEQVLRFARQRPDLLAFADQNAINAFLHGQIGEIDLSWNYQTIHKAFRDGTMAATYIHTKIENPRILHFVTSEKPWIPSCEMEERREFLRHWQASGWPLPEWASAFVP